MNTNDKQFLSNSLKWMSIYIGISLSISFLVPFPVSLVVIVIAFLLISFIRRRLMMKKMGMNMNGLFNPASSRSNGYSSVKYFCMSCGHQHKEIACPKCGSKMKRIG
jgi:hypothetical protein